MKPLVAALLAAGSALAVGRLWPADESLLYAVAGMAVLLASYAGLILLFGFTGEERAIAAAAWVRLGTLGRRAQAIIDRGN